MICNYVFWDYPDEKNALRLRDDSQSPYAQSDWRGNYKTWAAFEKLEEIPSTLLNQVATDVNSLIQKWK